MKNACRASLLLVAVACGQPAPSETAEGELNAVAQPASEPAAAADSQASAAAAAAFAVPSGLVCVSAPLATWPIAVLRVNATLQQTSASVQVRRGDQFAQRNGTLTPDTDVGGVRTATVATNDGVLT